MESSNKEIVMPMPSPSQRRNLSERAVEAGLFMLDNERTRDLVFPTRSIFHRGSSYATPLPNWVNFRKRTSPPLWRMDPEKQDRGLSGILSLLVLMSNFQSVNSLAFKPKELVLAGTGNGHLILRVNHTRWSCDICPFRT